MYVRFTKPELGGVHYFLRKEITIPSNQVSTEVAMKTAFDRNYNRISL